MSLSSPIYLDYHATTPVDPRVLEQMLPFFGDQFGNAASSTHVFGWAAADAVKSARETLAEGIGCTSQEVIFTSGATESINLAIKGGMEAFVRKGDHLIVAATEHRAVLDTGEELARGGKQVSYLSVNGQGHIDLDELRSLMRPETVMVCVMLANNETGLIHPVAEISEVVHAGGALMMCDAVQALGKMAVNVDELGVDLMSLSAHKMYGPKGVGALYVRRRAPRARVLPQLHGGGHERGLRSGTLNVPGIVGMGAALRCALEEMKSEAARLGALRDRLEGQLLALPDTCVNGDAQHRLAHTSNLRFDGIDSHGLIKAMPGIAVATGSACSSAQPGPSHVLQAMGLDETSAKASLRFSLGRFTTPDEIARATAIVRRGVEKLRAENPAYPPKS